MNFKNLLVILIGIFLNQSSVIAGVNFSFSDIFLLIFILYLIINREKWINPKIITIILIIISYLLILNLIITPLIWKVEVSILKILIEIIKLFLLFLYLLFGIYVTRKDYIDILLKAFMISSIVISIYSLLLKIINLPFKEEMFYAGVRLRGFMNDPNIYGIFQVCALSILINTNMSFLYKGIFFTTIISTIMLSGSKTSFICLIVLLIINIIKFVKITSYSNIMMLFGLLLLLIFLNIVYGSVLFSNFQTSFGRVYSLIFDTKSAISDGGSDRTKAWLTALDIIFHSYFLGVGLGSYLIISKNNYDVEILAHNTYLQLIAEWGAGLTILISFYLLIKMIYLKLFFISKDKYILELMCYFLIGSLAISLNNSRLLWLIIGWLVIKKSSSNDNSKRKESVKFKVFNNN